MKLIKNIPASFFFAFGFLSQIIGMLLGGIANMCLSTAMRTTAKKGEDRSRYVDECRDEVLKWEKEQEKS
jgi:hypothetical protein